jgi:hypothetical protein
MESLYKAAMDLRRGWLPSKGPRVSFRDWKERFVVVVGLSVDRSIRSWIDRPGVALPARASLTLSLLDSIHWRWMVLVYQYAGKRSWIYSMYLWERKGGKIGHLGVVCAI